jgi:alcohol dehydrogenase
MDHLEGVGKGIPYIGPATAFIAIPTTSGTGSEATKNAVLTHLGEQGYKKSFRHDTLAPGYAIIDPDLLASCPPQLIAANGMDAFTQLLESYVSTNANPFTDALALSGILAVSAGFSDAWRNSDTNKAQEGRAAMAYAALLSGITLAQAGLGAVHGLASPLGALFPIGHGVVCGALLAAATEVNIRALKQRSPDSPALGKYAEIGRLLNKETGLSNDQAQQALVNILKEWTTVYQIPRLGDLGVDAEHYDKIVANSRGNSMKTNPIYLYDEEILAILQLAA